jgi:two-component system sensor histidine kinase ChiS
MDQGNPQTKTNTLPPSPTPESAGSDDEIVRLRNRVAELQRERDHLVAIVDILQEVSSATDFRQILQVVSRTLGDAFGLERCTIYLAGDANEIRLVATYDAPSVKNFVVDLKRYPELQRAFESRETVFIPDAVTDPSFQNIRETLDSRNVRSIVVVPIQSQGAVIGAIFLRTDRGAEPFSDADVRFCQVVASLTANLLRNAHRLEAMLRTSSESARTRPHGQEHR